MLSMGEEQMTSCSLGPPKVQKRYCLTAIVKYLSVLFVQHWRQTDGDVRGSSSVRRDQNHPV